MEPQNALRAACHDPPRALIEWVRVIFDILGQAWRPDQKSQKSLELILSERFEVSWKLALRAFGGFMTS